MRHSQLRPHQNLEICAAIIMGAADSEPAVSATVVSNGRAGLFSAGSRVPPKNTPPANTVIIVKATTPKLGEVEPSQ